MPTFTEEELAAPVAPPPEEAPPVEQVAPVEEYPTPPPEEAPAVAPSEYTTTTDTFDVVDEGGQVVGQASAETPTAGVEDTYQPGEGDFRSQTETGQEPVTMPPPPADNYDPSTYDPVYDPGVDVGDAAYQQATRDQYADSHAEPIPGNNTFTEEELAAPPPPPGPLQEAANAIGGAVAPLVSQLPEPVQNVANIVGQPVGGVVDAAQNVTNELGQGDIPGAIGAGLTALSGPQQRVDEQTIQRLEEGKPAIPGIDEIAADPGNLLALQGGIATTYGPAPALSGLTLEDYYNQHRDELAGLSAAEVHDRWMQAAGAMDTPPAQLSNPLDAATSANPIERAGQVASAIPDFITGWGDSAQQGTLKPFVLGQVQAITEDPLSLIPGALTERLVGRAGEAIGRAVPEPIRRLGELTPQEQVRLEGERLGASGTEYLTAAEEQAPQISPVTGRPLIEPGTLPEVEDPLRQQLDTVGLPDVGVQLTNDIRDVNPTLSPTTASHYDPATNTIHLALDTTRIEDLPGVLEREANTVLTNRGKQEAVTNAYATTPLNFQRSVRSVMPQNPVILRTVQMSTEGAEMMSRPAAGRIKFRDGWNPTDMPLVDVAEQLRRDTDSWLEGFTSTGEAIDAVQATPQWKALNRRSDPNGVVDVRPMLGNSPRARQLRSAHSSELFTDAINNAQKVPARANKLGAAYGTYTNAIRQSMLFNVLNTPRYIAQNLTTNTINIKVRGGGIRPAFDVFTDLGEMKRVFGNQRDPLRHTSLDSMLHQIGMGDRPNIKQNQRAYFDRVGQGTTPKWLDIPLRTVAPETVRFLASVPDVMGRVEVGSHALMDGFHEFNKTLAPRFNEIQKKQLGRYGHVIPADKVQQVMGDFLKEHRTLIDQNTGLPQKGLLGRTKSLEPMWNPDDLGKYLREHLDEDMAVKPDRGLYNRSINEMVGQSRDSIRGILDAADAKVDYALFPWRDTVGDAALGKATLFHYYMTRQGGFYVSEGMKHPWVAAAYGRMLDEMQQQNEESGGPAWLTGWFQFQRSVGGFSTWFSPTDFIQSLLTGAAFAQESDPDAWRDMTRLGELVKGFPFFVHPMLIGVGYAAGALGPQYPAPNLTGAETFGANAINLFNLANFQDAPFMKIFNAMGMGVDANGNKVPIPPRPLNELYARVGNALSTALAPITGLTPDEVVSSGAGLAVDVKTIGMQETRAAHPEWDTGEDPDEMQIMQHVTEVLADPNSPEYKDWYQKATSEPYQMGAGWPQPLAALARIASPIGVATMPEQKAVDKFKGGLEPSGQTPLRSDATLGEKVRNQSLYGVANTVEARQLNDQVNEYKAVVPPDQQAAKTEGDDIAYCTENECRLDHDVEIGGATYTPEELQALEQSARYDLKDQYLLEQGYDEEAMLQAKDDQLEYLANHPDVAAYQAYLSLVDQAAPEGTPEELKAKPFVDQAVLTNPSFAQYVRTEMTDPDTGAIDYGKAFSPPAFLALQGVRSSEYSPLTGNDPSTAPGGYPSIPGVDEGQPILPIKKAVAEAYVYRESDDVVGGKYSAKPVARLDPSLPVMTLGPIKTVNDKYNNGTYIDTTHDMVQISQPDNPDQPIGWVDVSLLTDASPARPVGGGAVQQFGQGGLAQTAGQVTSALGAAKDTLLTGTTGGLGDVAAGIGNAITTVSGHNSGAPQKPAITTPQGISGTGSYDVVPAKDGMGIQSTEAGTDRTWMENMMDGHAAVTVDYKGPAPQGVSYAYQDGHGAIDGEHAAYDISCDTGNCAGTPITSPVSGKVVCSGYGQGTGDSLAGCTYSQNTTTANNDGSPPAHTVVIDVGTDPQGNHLQLSFNHMGTSDLQPGQTISPGDLIGGMGNTDGGPHTHLEAWGFSPELGTYKILDPALVVGGYYQTHSVDDTTITPAPSSPSTTTAAPSTIPSKITPRTSPGLTPGDPAPYQPVVEQAATENNVPPEILGALLQQESQYDPAALSPAGAQGIAQFMPDTAQGYGIDPYDPNQAIPAAAQMLAENYRRFGSWELALAAYNAGAGNVEKYGGIPPFPETESYVATIMGNAGH